MACGGLLQIAFNGIEKTLEISHWDSLQRLKSLFQWPVGATLSLESDKEVKVGKTLKHLTKLLDRPHGIGRGYDEGMESRSVMVPANGMVHKLRNELRMTVHYCLASYSWYTWTLEVSTFAYYFPC